MTVTGCNCLNEHNQWKMRYRVSSWVGYDNCLTSTTVVILMIKRKTFCCKLAPAHSFLIGLFSSDIQDKPCVGAGKCSTCRLESHFSRCLHVLRFEMLGLAVRRNFREKEVYFFSNSRFKTQFMTPSKHSYSQLPTHTATSDGYLRGHA